MHITLTMIQSIYEEQVEALYKYFYFKTLSTPDAEDLTSQTFLEFTKSVVAEKSIDDPVKYLYGVAHNVFIAYLKKRYTQEELVQVLTRLNDGNPQELVEEYTELVESQPTLEERANHFIQQLPEKQRLLITLRLIDKLTPSEISDKIGKDTNYVKTTLKRGMKSLRQAIACTPAATIITEPTDHV